MTVYLGFFGSGAAKDAAKAQVEAARAQAKGTAAVARQDRRAAVARTESQRSYLPIVVGLGAVAALGIGLAIFAAVRRRRK